MQSIKVSVFSIWKYTGAQQLFKLMLIHFLCLTISIKIYDLADQAKSWCTQLPLPLVKLMLYYLWNTIYVHIYENLQEIVNHPFVELRMNWLPYIEQTIAKKSGWTGKYLGTNIGIVCAIHHFSWTKSEFRCTRKQYITLLEMSQYRLIKAIWVIKCSWSMF